MVTRQYHHDGLTIHWDSSRCIHAAVCGRRGGGVFDVRRRPWVDPTAADRATTIAAIEGCPSGALRWSTADDVEVPDAPATLRPVRGGPLMVRGDVRVVDRQGREIGTGPRATLCRCGNSGNQPFCDNSHRTAGFDEPEPRGADTHPTTPAAPDEICPPQEF